MTTWTLILMILLPTGVTDMVVERQYWTQAECEKNAARWKYAFQERAPYVQSAHCLRQL